ncbi:MAG: hypothetical protein BGO77_07860 [Caedibacter sp. 37-49]|nr:MAG: hypothetical protein BGO77_07860 [Caedibacter sp. 37-49]
MKIFHGPHNISGMASILAAAQRSLGVSAEAHCYNKSVFGYKVDKEFNHENFRGATSIIKFAANFDVFHFYFGESLDTFSLRDLPLLNSLGKKIFMYFCGCDIRNSKQAIATRKYSACSHCWAQACNYNREYALKIVNEFADGIFVSTPDLLDTVPEATLLLQPVDSNSFLKFSRKFNSADYENLGTQQNPLRLVHAPSSQKLKGTEYVMKSIEELQAQGIHIQLSLLENMPWEQALHEYANAHIGIDQLLIGSYGSFSVELMALGVPVICYLHEHSLAHYPEPPPIINANLENLTEVILSLLTPTNNWEKLIKDELRYVSQHHDHLKVGKKALDHYSKRKKS